MPTPAPRAAPRRSPMSRIIRLFRPYWRSAILVGIAVVGAATLGLANPLLVRQIIDRALPSHDLRLLGLLTGSMVAITLLGGAIDTLETYETTRVGQRVM